MFQDEAQISVSFESSWKTQRSVQDAVAQTSEIITYEQEVQVITQSDAAVQTEDEEEKPAQIIEHIDSKNLTDFILRVYPGLSKQLQANIRSHAFDGYDVDWEEKLSSVSCIQTLTHGIYCGQLEITGLSWNSSGSVIAASYGRYDHQDWCTHKSALCTWNIDSRNINPQKAETVIDLSSCLMCISFHPKIPALIAGGNFNGEVQVWDIGREDDSLVASSGIGNDSHREPVTKVMWSLDASSKENKYQIVSVSGDGKILVWSMNPMSSDLKLVNGFVLLTENLPRSLRVSKARGDSEMGVTCLSFSHEDKSLFVIGSEGGGIFKCSVNARGTASTDSTCSVSLRSPVTFAFHPHFGPVYSIDCSPYHRNLFLTSGTDTSVRLYSMLQSKPLLSLEPAAGYLFCVRWSPVRPLVFFVATADGRLLIYDLKVNQINPVISLDASQDKMPLYTLEYNIHRRQLIASGDGNGVIRVWQLSDDLINQATNEQDFLADIAAAQTE